MAKLSDEQIYEMVESGKYSIRSMFGTYKFDFVSFARAIETEAIAGVRDTDEIYKRIQQARLDWRMIGPDHNKPLCDGRNGCGGSGYKIYGSTSTWRHGIGGQAMTSDVCDQCWGSGTTMPWPSHRIEKSK